jgi:hypothetical protein
VGRYVFVLIRGKREPEAAGNLRAELQETYGQAYMKSYSLII